MMLHYCCESFWIRVIQAGDKYWYILAVAAVILWQCIATDIYAFHWSSFVPQPHNVTVLTTLEPNSTSATTATMAAVTTSS